MEAPAFLLAPPPLVSPVGVGGDACHDPLMRILIAARSRGVPAIDGPYLKVRDAEGMRRPAEASRKMAEAIVARGNAAGFP
jgi:hypothetical protein